MADEKPEQRALHGSGKRFAIIAARFNQSVVDSMIAGALDVLEKHQVDVESVPVIRVPGSFELPLAAKSFAERHADTDAVIALGAVIRGETAHFDFVAGQCASGLQRAALDTGTPMVFGVLTTDTMQQAIERADPAAGDKGGDAARAALEMADLLARL
ncbi:MAG: 6,7-dimethyl-8-ribityllumazine synthase [Gammaproteobacteria bacterium]|nr:6,7-dimethyl-8-ribityllumazine synthase [Gammaproteobacteria bacterium]